MVSEGESCFLFSGRIENIKNLKDGKIIKKIENYIQEYDSVFVLNTRILKNKTIFQGISKYSGKKILLLTKSQEIDDVPKGSIDILRISDKEYCSIEELYYMYEFSDRIHLLTDSTQYGSLDNYILNGMLTEEEAFTALMMG